MRCNVVAEGSKSEIMVPSGAEATWVGSQLGALLLASVELPCKRSEVGRLRTGQGSSAYCGVELCGVGDCDSIRCLAFSVSPAHCHT